MKKKIRRIRTLSDGSRLVTTKSYDSEGTLHIYKYWKKIPGIPFGYSEHTNIFIFPDGTSEEFTTVNMAD